jgi:hypothetical protein
MRFDDEPGEYLAKLRPPKLVPLTCPDCPHTVYGLTGQHAAELLAIHREGTCQGGGERR